MPLDDANASWYVEVITEDDTLEELVLIDPDVSFALVDPNWLANPQDNRKSLLISATSTSSFVDVKGHAQRIIASCNTKLLADSALHAPISIGPYIWQRDPSSPNGFRCGTVVEAPTSNITISGLIGVVDINGYEIAPSRTVGLRQKKLAAQSLDFSHAVWIFGEAGEDIRKLWLPVEYFKYRSGIKVKDVISDKDWNNILYTANDGINIRHIGGEKRIKYKILTGAEYREAVRGLLLAWLGKKIPY